MQASPTESPVTPVRKKRRWWFYVLIAVGALVVLGITLVAAIALYINSLVKTYAQEKQETFPAVDTSKAAQERLQAKWVAFGLALNNPSRAKPMELSPDELNLSVATRARGLQNRVQLFIEGDQLKGRFSLPLGNTRNPKKKQKYLNGEAVLKLALDNGFLSLKVDSVKANGKPLPGWIWKKLKRQNLLWFFDENYEVLEFLQKLDTIDVQNGAVVLTPYVPPEQ